MFPQTTTTVVLLLCTTALGQLALPNASFAYASGTPTIIDYNFTTTAFNNATATAAPAVDACVIFVSANGTVPAFTITSEFPVPTSIFFNDTLNSTCTSSAGFDNSTASSFVTEQFNSTVYPGPFPTNVSSFATTFYATVWTSGGFPSTSYALPSVPSGLPVCPNITINSNGTDFNSTNATLSGQSLNSNNNSNKPSSAISVIKVGRDLAGAVIGVIGGVVLAVL